MKELLLVLLETANKLRPMRGIHTDWYTVGSFNFKGKVYSFMIKDNRGTCRCMTAEYYANEWFDVARTKNKFTSIIHNGIKYDIQPTLQL